MVPSKVLEVWEKCSGKNNLYLGLAMTSINAASETLEEIAGWSIEKRDRHLFHIRKGLFGKKFINTANCPNCNDKVEWEMNFDEFQIPELKHSVDDRGYNFEHSSFKIRYRLPTTKDLLTNNESQIIDNCILSCEQSDFEIKGSELSRDIKSELLLQMEQRSKASHIFMNLHCQECDHEWNTLFDIIPYLWAEINQWVHRFLDQVTVLAKAFGWSESSIINMSQARRNHYLNLLNS